MYWLQPPPYLRWTAAGMLLMGAFLLDLRGAATDPHPVAARPIAAGTTLTAADIAWRRLPEGSFPIPDLDDTTAAVDLAPGEPIIPAVLAPAVAIPADWWAVPIAVGTHALPGESVLLMVLDPPTTVPGIVVSAQHGDRFSLDHRPAVVAVPGDDATLVAAAAAAGMLVTAIRP